MKWLSGGGAAAALAVGGATVWGLGWRGLAMLLAFFVTSSALTRVREAPRTARQVLANGGIGAAAALLGSWPAFAGALAAATADTWATEIGARSRSAPRRITTWEPVPAGTSGGITALGTAAGVAGAGFLAAIGVLVEPATLLAAVTCAGVAGMLLDSVLGATVQGTERRGGGERLERGVAWIDNDAVNLAATAAGALVAWAIAAAR